MFELLFGFTLILTRISAFFLVLPVFGWQAIPLRIKVALTVLLSVFFTFITPLGIDPTNVSTVEAVLLLAGEATYGLAMGLIVVLLFSVVIVADKRIRIILGVGEEVMVSPTTKVWVHVAVPPTPLAFAVVGGQGRRELAKCLLGNVWGLLGQILPLPPVAAVQVISLVEEVRYAEDLGVVQEHPERLAEEALTFLECLG